MDSELTINPENPVEARKLKNLLEEYKEVFGYSDVVAVGSIGYVIQLTEEKSISGRDWVLFDYDDTLVATTEIKNKRLMLYREYVKNKDIKLSDKQVYKIIDMTDRFSRWEENEGERKIYHANAHMAALQWITSVFQGIEGEIQEETIMGLEENLVRIQGQLIMGTESRKDDPFYFRPKDRKFILHGVDKMWSRDIEDIFKQTMIRPPQYDEIIEVARGINKLDPIEHQIDLGIFTYGDPYYQLLKVLELIKQNPDLVISQIWLTSVSKGDFITEVVRRGVDSEGRVVVILDDNPREISSILSIEGSIREYADQFIPVHSKRGGLKDRNVGPVHDTQYNMLDFETQEFSSKEILDRLLAVIKGGGTRVPI